MNIQERKKEVANLIEQIQYIERSPTKNYSERNKLVTEMKQLRKDLPFDFEVGELAQVNLKRLINVKVMKIFDLEDRLLLVKPIDPIYKEEFAISERALRKSI
jgi:hypothetical protein